MSNNKNENKCYESLGLSKENVLEIQGWLFPMMNETQNVSQMIIKTIDRFDGMKKHYALYLIGSEIGQAHVKQAFGLSHILNPENV